jgi:hypothetical protein
MVFDHTYVQYISLCSFIKKILEILRLCQCHFDVRLMKPITLCPNTHCGCLRGWKGVLIRIFGSKWEEVMGDWRRRHNAELHNLYVSPHIIVMMKSRRVRWACSTHGRDEKYIKIMEGSPSVMEGRREYIE